LASRTPLEEPPDPDEVEVFVFGPGIGESVVIHLGLGEWIVIDSCIDSRTREAAALQYLGRLGVDVRQALKLVVVTHWHNDHMLGASKVFEAAESAAMVCSGALKTPEFAQLIAASDRERLGELEVPEFAKILEILRARKRGARAASVGPIWAVEGRVLYTRASTPECGTAEVLSLSPSDGAMTLAHREFARYLPKYNEAQLTLVALSPNNVAVVLWVKVGNARILLGSDLEESPSPTLGWHAIINSKVRDTSLGHMLKIPHHGSVTGHNNDVWNEMLMPSPVVALTPFLRGRTPLPSESDIARIKARTPNAYATSRPGGWRPLRREPTVERLLGRRLRAMTGDLGHVRVRWSSRQSSPVPAVDLFSGATRL
jgi:beta-lactamase superfamily II metal-dependent hydrolase